MKEYNMIEQQLKKLEKNGIWHLKMPDLKTLSGGVDMSYQSTLILQLVRRLERKTKRKNKIKRIWNL
jgi:hypothetical protein